MATLNIVNKSPFEKRSLDQCLARIGEGDGILLIEDATVVAVGNTSYSVQLESVSKHNKCYVLQPDLLARGVTDLGLLEGFSAVDYEGFVDLVTEFDRVHSWL